MKDKTSGTKRDNAPIISSGVSPSGTGTKRDSRPLIPSGISAGTPSPMVSSGIAPPGSKILLNGKSYKILKVITKATGEAEVYLLDKDNQKTVFKYYYPNFKPKDDLLKKLKGLHNDNTIDLIDYGYYHDRFFEILEYAEGGSLAAIQEDGKYKYIPLNDIKRIRQIIKETVNALSWCHAKGIIHRDLKPENIFFKNPDGTDVLIGDFGISSILDEGLSKHMTNQARTEIYAAPELYQSIGGKTVITKAVDYYSLGITLLFVWQAKDPFEGLKSLAIMRIKLEGKVDIPEEIPEELKHLIKGLITVEPSKRWGYEEVLKWIKGEYVPVYHKIVETKYPDFHFGVIAGEDITTHDPVELAELLAKYTQQGIKHLYKGTIQRWVENVNQSLYVEIRGIVEDDYPQDQDAGLTKAIYILDPMKNYKTFSGAECRTAEEIGDALERESSYYKSFLTQKKHADLFLFLEARGAKSEADTFRKYAQAFSPEKAFHTIILELQGKDRFKLDDLVFLKPEDLLSSEDQIKDKLVTLLLNPESKLSLWLEQFPALKENIEKWRKLGKHNIITLAYALDEKSPFTALGEKVYNLDEFKTFFAKQITDKDLIAEMTTSDSAFVTEADFWLEQYQNSSYLDIVISYFQKNIEQMHKRVCRKLCDYLIEARSDIKNYWEDVRPIVDKALRNITPSHQMIKRSEKEEKLFDLFKESRLEEIEEEKEKRIAKVKSDIEEQVQKRKEKARKNYDSGKVGYLGAIIGAVIGAITGAGDVGVKLISVAIGASIGGAIGGGFVGSFLGDLGAKIGAIIGTIAMPVVFMVMVTTEEEGGLAAVVGFILGAISGYFILKAIVKSNAADKVTITPAEEKDRDKRIENIKKDIQNRIANLDNEIRKEIFKKTEEEINEMFRNMG